MATCRRWRRSLWGTWPPTDEKDLYTVAKRGGTEDVTLEMIKNDDVGVIRQILVKLSRSAKRTLGKFVLDFLADNPKIHDGATLFHAGHHNLGAAALGRTFSPPVASPCSVRPNRVYDKIDSAALSVGAGRSGRNRRRSVPSHSENDKTFVQSQRIDVMPVGTGRTRTTGSCPPTRMRSRRSRSAFWTATRNRSVRTRQPHQRLHVHPRQVDLENPPHLRRQRARLPGHVRRDCRLTSFGVGGRDHTTADPDTSEERNLCPWRIIKP